MAKGPREDPSRFLHRELVLLLVLVGVTIAAFFGTRSIADSNEALRRRQAAAWHDAVQRTPRGHDAGAAVVALRRVEGMISADTIAQFARQPRTNRRRG
jgi:hypothetical protein